MLYYCEKDLNLYCYYYLFEFLNTASKIFLIEIANNLKKTKLMPSQPNNTAIDNKLDPRSRCKNPCIKNEFFVNSL